MKLHITYNKRNKTVEVQDSKNLMGLKINSYLTVSRHPQLGFLKEEWGYQGLYLKIRGATGLDGTPVRCDLNSVRPIKIKLRGKGGVHRLMRFRPNRIDSHISVVDCIAVE